MTQIRLRPGYGVTGKANEIQNVLIRLIRCLPALVGNLRLLLPGRNRREPIHDLCEARILSQRIPQRI